MKYNDNGEYKDIYVKAFDTLPIGTQVNFNGTSADIPNGWEQVGTSGGLLIIEKTSQYIEGGASLSNAYGTSTTDGYSQRYINANIPLMKDEYGSSLSDGYSQDYCNKYYGGTSLYNSSSGTSGNVNLSSSAANFSYIEIYYKDNDGYYNSAKIKSPNGKVVLLFAGTTDRNGYWMKCRNVKINGTTISTFENRYGQYSNDGYSYTNYIYITDVIGYK